MTGPRKKPDVADETALDGEFGELPDGVQPIETAPRTGQRIILVGEDGQSAPAVWRETRRYDRKTIRWVPHAFWADPLNSNAPVALVPIGWREDEFRVVTGAPV